MAASADPGNLLATATMLYALADTQQQSAFRL
jgi:hypothetical protein